MGFFKKLFGNNKDQTEGRPDVNDLLSSNDTDRLILELDTYISKLAAYGDEMNKLTEPQKVFFLNQNFEREINNGGLNQYFYNSSGEFALETLISLQTIGANKTANILQEAIAQFPNSTIPKDTQERRSLLEKMEDKSNEVWEKLDQKFYTYEDNLYDLNIQYIKQNRTSF